MGHSLIASPYGLFMERCRRVDSITCLTRPNLNAAASRVLGLSNFILMWRMRTLPRLSTRSESLPSPILQRRLVSTLRGRRLRIPDP